MAVIYCDPGNISGAANDSNAGTAYTAPKANIGGASGASAAAGANGEVRIIGNAMTAVTGTTMHWTYNSATVTCTSQTITAGSFLYPSNGVDSFGGDAACPFQVQTGGAPTTSITLRCKWQGATGDYTTYILTTQTWAAQTMTSGTTGQKISFGWDCVNGGQTSGYVTCPYAASTLTLITVGQADTEIDATNLLLCANYSSSVELLRRGANFRVIGALRLAVGFTTAVGDGGTGNTVAEFDNVIASFGSASKFLYSGSASAGSIRAIRVFAHGGSAFSLSGQDINLGICYLNEMGSATHSSSSGPGAIITIGKLYIRNGPVGGPPQVSTGLNQVLDINEIDATDTNSAALVPTGAGVRVRGPVGAPAAGTPGSRLYVFPSGTTVDYPGPSATGYGLRMTPTSTTGAFGRRPAQSPIIRRLIPSGKSLTLLFNAVYTGTAADAPESWVELCEPNGYTVQRYMFTPPRSANTPGGSPDGWSDSTQQSIAFGGTSAHDGVVGFRICCVSNNANDSVLYIGPFTWTVA